MEILLTMAQACQTETRRECLAALISQVSPFRSRPKIRAWANEDDQTKSSRATSQRFSQVSANAERMIENVAAMV